MAPSSTGEAAILTFSVPGSASSSSFAFKRILEASYSKNVENLSVIEFASVCEFYFFLFLSLFFHFGFNSDCQWRFRCPLGAIR